jgi:hypothetical protein
VVGNARMPAIASVAGSRPACMSTHPVPSSGPGRPAVWCAARPVSSRPVSDHLGSSSGVRRSGRLVSTQPASGRVVSPNQRPAVWCHLSGVQPSGVRPPSVRTRPSPPTSGGVGDQMVRRGNLHHGNGSRSRWLPRRRAARSTAEAWMTRLTYRGRTLVGGVSAADPAGLGEGGGGRTCPLPTR